MTSFRTLAWRGRALSIVLACLVALIVSTRVQAQASPSAYTWATRYDAMGRVSGTIAPDPDGSGPLHFAAVRNSYDSAGRLVLVEKGELTAWQSEAVAPSAWTSFSIFQTLQTDYDSLGHKTRDKASGLESGLLTLKTVTDYSYDSSGRLQCTAVRMNEAAFGSLPASACTQSATGSNGPDRITKNVYDAAGQLLQTRQGVGTALERAEATYSYTPDGKKQDVIDAGGNRAQFSYDGFDRLAQWQFPSPTPVAQYDDSSQPNALATAGSPNASDYEQYTYDPNDNRKTLRKRDGRTLTFNYDGLNRAISKIVPDACVSGFVCATPPAGSTRDVYFTYDLLGHQLTARFDAETGADGITTAFDGFGNLASSAITMGTLSRMLNYAWDPEGHRVEITHPDNLKFTYARDGLSRVANIYEGTSQISTAQLVQATFNNRGLIGAFQRSVGPGGFMATYTYDAIGRLSSIANDATSTSNDLTIANGLNPASEIVSQGRNNDSYSWTGSVVVNRNYTTNGLNQYTAAATSSFCYDTNGNLIADGSNVYVYDVENRLLEKRVQVSGGCPATAADYSGTLQASLTYDPMGKLWQVTGPSSNNRFLYDGDELAAEYDYAGNIANRYVHSDNVDDPVVLYGSAAVGASQRIFLMPDERGSIAGLFYDNGTIYSKNSYDEYGIPGQYNQGRFQYTGQIWLPELGMYYYKARIYSPTLGRFLQTDPVGYNDQVNLYAYVGDDPVNRIDPKGLEQGSYGSDGTYFSPGDRPESEGKIHSVREGIQLQLEFAGALVGALFAPAIGADAAAASVASESSSVIAENAGSYSVYTSTVKGVTEYVGHTGRELSARAGEHLRSSGRVIRPLITGLSKQAAKGVEQAVIEARGLAKQGGTLANKINSVAKSNPAYEETVKLGRAILDELGFKR